MEMLGSCTCPATAPRLATRCADGAAEAGARLKPCPLCGGRCKVVESCYPLRRTDRRARIERLLRPALFPTGRFGVECLGCGAQMDGFADADEAVGGWNVRAACAPHAPAAPCPVCGGDASVVTRRYGSAEFASLGAWVECGSCGLAGSAEYGVGEDAGEAVGKAVEAWNGGRDA